MILGLCFGVATWTLFFFGHLATMRGTAPAKRAHRDKYLFAMGFIIIPSSVGAATLNLEDSIWTQGGWIMGTLWGVLVYISLFALYMPFFYTVTASLSVCTVVLLAKATDNSLPIAILMKKFGSHDLVAKRLLVMAQHGLLSQRGNEYWLTCKGWLVARAFAALKQFWRLGPGG